MANRSICSLAFGLVLLAQATTLAQSQPVTGDEAWRLLAQTGSVVLIRHGRTNGGAGDPPGFVLENCASQRNLTDDGRTQARALGEAFRARKVEIAEVLSSRWCRCLETARLAFDRVDPFPALDNMFGDRSREPAQTAALRQRIRDWKGPGTVVMVSHGVNIMALTGMHPAEGEVFVLRPDANNDFKFVGRIALAP